MKKNVTLLLFAVFVLATKKSSAQCDAPINLLSSYSNNVSTFSWDAVPNALSYGFQIRFAGNVPWATYLQDVPVTGNTYTITGLMQGGNFQWRVRAICGSGAGNYTVALLSTPCVQPQNLSTTQITSNSAVLNWEHVPGINNNNTGFSVSYRVANSSAAWIQLTDIYNNPTATFLNLTGLAANTAYEWRVRRVCSATNSDYLTSQFTTSPAYCISSGINLTNCGASLIANWISYFKLGAINRTSVSEPGGYALLNESTNLVIGSTSNAGQISAGFSGSVTNSRFMIWIDFNRDGIFSNTGERLILNTAAASVYGTTIKNFSVNIPATATPGPTRMRVFSIRNSGNVSNSCLTGYLGETEDYTVNLVAPSSFAKGNADFAKKETEFSLENKTAIVSAAPNPSTGLFTITLSNGFDAARYEVANTSGVVIQKNVLNRTRIFQINISRHSKGMYLLTIFDKKGTKQTSKLLVQ